MHQEPLTTLELLIRQEVAAKRLYEAFAIMFPEEEEFWTKIAAEEQNHADLLIKLRSKPNIETWFIDEMQLSPEVIKKSTDYVNDKREFTLKGHVNLEQAFSLAENVERFLIDGVFIKLEQRPSINTPRAMLTLAEETKKHRELVLQKQKVLFRK